jgi:hypothetical protein
MKTLLVLRCTVLAAAVAVAAPAHADSPDAAMSTVAGQWTGAWWAHPPAPMAPRPLRQDCRQRLDCTVVCENGQWRATFEGECGQPYKFTITMAGRQSGQAVLFKGTTDLGEENGGEYDWIGRAAGDEFAGFFTSSEYAGEFRLQRTKE